MVDDARLNRVLSRLQNLPSISLPTDYPRPLGAHKLIEAAHNAQLSSHTSLSLLKLVLYTEEDIAPPSPSSDEDDDNDAAEANRPSAFHLLLAAFTVLLHRYTGDTDIVVGSSSSASSLAQTRDPLVLRLQVDPADPYWAIVRRLQQVEKEAEIDAVPFDILTAALPTDAPLFRVRFFDETDSPVEFIRSTNLTSDLTVFISSTSPSTSQTSTRAPLTPQISLRILYNSLLFTPARITGIVDQLSAFLRVVAHNPLAPVGSVTLVNASERKILPDPTSELGWCEWKGAITDVFTRNAQERPNRTCVVQYLPEGTPVNFSYSQILRASNILAHHLIKGGVQREEVVMVYAHRSVELVVAVMAVLKAGATFSVIGSCYQQTNPFLLIYIP